ncbi:MAG: T9SS type A sorting domain-containing protein [Bacteroidota bacterium]|nr:T9SS type A sorting domain-containing protein [Bacteroidota bacterium]
MKKLLLAALLFTSAASFAQMTRDIKIDLIKPAAGDKVINGQPFEIEYIITNTSAEPTIASDSMIVLYILNNNQQLNIPGQSPSIFTNRVLNQNDTIWRKFTLTLTINGTTGPTPIPFCTRMFAQNGNQTIDPNQANNNACNTVTVSLSEINKALAGMKVYPNPALDVLTVSFDYKDAKEIKVLDLSGKLLSTTTVTGVETNVEVANLATGIYLYQITDINGANIAAGKFSVSK